MAEELRGIVVDNISDLTIHARQLFGLDGRRSLWFRGHSSADWQLIPSVHRSYSFEDELDLTTRFRLGAPTRYPQCPASGDFAAWLCLMQHYGLPTRLLDWTESILVAAFFAVGFEDHDQDAAIWALNPGRLNYYFKGAETLSILSHASVDHILRPAFVSGEATDDVLAVQTPDIDLRMALQQGVFTIHGSERPLETHQFVSEFLVKFVVKQSSRREFAHDLWLLGIRRSLIFPDLQNLAIELQRDFRHQGRMGRFT